MRKSTKILFTLSVILNVLLIGSHAGMVYTQWQEQENFQKVRAELTPEGQNLVARSFRNTFRDIKPYIEKAGAARKELIDVLEDEEFDAAAFDAAVANMRAQQNGIMDAKIATMKDLAQELPAADRAKLADKFASALEQRKRNHHDRRMRDKWHTYGPYKEEGPMPEGAPGKDAPPPPPPEGD